MRQVDKVYAEARFQTTSFRVKFKSCSLSSSSQQGGFLFLPLQVSLPAWRVAGAGEALPPPHLSLSALLCHRAWMMGKQPNSCRIWKGKAPLDQPD
jgi:hypothetical protein